MSWGLVGVGLVSPKSAENVGGAMRAAHCYRASLIAIEDDRSSSSLIGHATDTPNSWRRIPTLRGNLQNLVPHGCVTVAVDLVDGAEPLSAFQHPKRAFYIFGPEDGTLGSRHLSMCERRVMIPTRNCMNLASTVCVVLYDRLAKYERQARGLRNSDVGPEALTRGVSSGMFGT